MGLFRSLNTNRLWSGAITVAVLALVLIGFAAFNAPGAKKPEPSLAPAESEAAVTSGALYQQALRAQQSGDLTRTAELARSAVAADPSNTAAQALLDSVARPTPTSPDSPSPTATPPASAPSDAPFLKTYKALSVLLPKAFEGYDVSIVGQVGRDISLTGEPKALGTPVRRAIWTVHDLKSRTAAKAFISKTSKRAFPKDGESVMIDRVPAYFGTDGMQVASVSFVRGRYVFEVLLTADGVAPVKMKAIGLRAARAFPDAPSK